MRKRKITQALKTIAQEAIPSHLDLWPAIQARLDAAESLDPSSDASSPTDSAQMVWESSPLLTQLKNDIKGLGLRPHRERRSIMLKRLALISSISLIALLVIIFGLPSGFIAASPVCAASSIAGGR
ncbi:MAG: hypothetical protein AB1801_13070 [Chloroflexota bacterium]